MPLDGKDVAGGGEEQDDHDEERHHRPRQLDLRAAVHLGRLATVVSRAAPVANDRVDRQAGDDDEDDGDDGQHEKGQLADGERRRGYRREDARGHGRPQIDTATARRKLSLLRARSEGGAALYVPSRPFFSKNTTSADRALPRGADQEPVGLSRG